MRRKVSFAVLPIDRFTRRNVSPGELSFDVNGELFRPVYKNDGYYVFADRPEGDYGLTVRGVQYQPESFNVKVDYSRQPDVITLLVNPGESYVRKENTFSVKGSIATKKGSARGGIAYYAVLSGEEAPFALAEKKAAAGSSVMKLYYNGPKSSTPVPGKFLLIEDGKEEEITILSAIDNDYFLDKPLERDYGRKVRIAERICGKTFESGGFYILLSKGKTQKIEIRFNIDGKVAKKEFDIKDELNDLGKVII